MELLVSLLGMGNTTKYEVAVLTQEVQDVLRQAPGVESLGPVRGPTPQGAKGVVEEIGSFLLGAAPASLKQILTLLKSVLVRPGQPMTEVVIQDRASKVTFKFNPKDVPLQDLVDNVLRLRDGPKRS